MDSLSRIGIFLAVAKQESFAAAARDLGLTSSAVSKQVLNLESELRTKLLNRTTRKVSLTEEGALFFSRASRAMEDIEEAREQMNELKTVPRGQLRISVPTALGSQYLKGPIAEFAVKYPEVTLDVQFEDRLIDIAEEGFDLVLRIAALSDSSMIARKLASCPFYLCCSPEYLKNHPRPHTAEDLVQHNVLAYTRNKGAHEWRFRDPDGKEGVVGLKSSFKCDSAEMMIEAACRGIGIMIAPMFFVKAELDKGTLVPVLTEYNTWPERSLFAVFPPNRFVSTRLRLFVDHIHAYCQQVFV
jgi:DNA-binding transcriptional LysR family regulator